MIKYKKKSQQFLRYKNIQILNKINKIYYHSKLKKYSIFIKVVENFVDI